VSDAQDRGWGPGWPVGVPPSQLTQVDVSGTRYPGGVRTEIAALVSLLTAECKARGYQFGTPNDPSYGCWGYSNRPVSGTQKPSNHSWGLAVDINAPRNPQKRPLTTDMPAWMPALWKRYRFDWGGDYQIATPDPMHFEYQGTPAQAADDTARARADLTGDDDMTPDQAESLAECRRMLAVILQAQPPSSPNEVPPAVGAWRTQLGPSHGLGPAPAETWLMDTRAAAGDGG
jgi:D-alanyl-D-alanine carboxypeptidase